jgi:hypothetical protein
MANLPQEFRTTPFSYYVWSRSRRAGHVLAFAIAKFIDPSFRWITVRESTEEPSVEESWVRLILPDTRVPAPVSVSDLGEGPRVSRETFESMIRPEGAMTERVALDHFLLLPPRIQRMLDEGEPSSGPRAIVVANTNRVRLFYPNDPDRLRALMDVFPRNGISIITTSLPPPYEGRYGYSIALRLDVRSAEDWRAAELVVEKGLPSGELRTGAAFTSEKLPWYIEAGTAIEKATG